MNTANIALVERLRVLLGEYQVSVLVLFVWDTFNSCPTSNHWGPSNDRVHYNWVWMQHHIFQYYRINNSGSFTDFHFSAYCDIWAYLCVWMDFSWWMNADNSFDLATLDISRFREDRRFDWLVIRHVHLLSFKQFSNMVDAQPEVLFLIQVIEVCFLLIAKR